MLLAAIDLDRLAGFESGKFRRGSMLVRGADEQRVASPRPLKARVNIGRKHRADQIAQMLDAVDVRKRAGDEHARNAGTGSHTNRNFRE